MIGGFLGAGKTTAIGRLARAYTDAGLRVGIVTNDQAYDLVDTKSLRAQGFRVGEVPGACFCCKFDDLVETAAALSADERPDVIITEPVGSCTDLVATVIEPLRHLHDVVAINKVDKLSAAELDELLALVGERFGDKQVLAFSARDGTNFDAFQEAVGRTQAEHRKMMPVDYDIYAEGEAELGWLNCSIEFSQPKDEPTDGGEFSLDELLVDFVKRLGRALADDGAEVAHLKILGQAGSDPAIANLTSSDGVAELSLASEIRTDTAQLVVNARVAVDPEILAQVVEAEAACLARDYNLSCDITGLQHFRPGRPLPTHRVTD